MQTQHSTTGKSKQFEVVCCLDHQKLAKTSTKCLLNFFPWLKSSESYHQTLPWSFRYLLPKLWLICRAFSIKIDVWRRQRWFSLYTKRLLWWKIWWKGKSFGPKKLMTEWKLKARFFQWVHYILVAIHSVGTREEVGGPFVSWAESERYVKMETIWWVGLSTCTHPNVVICTKLQNDSKYRLQWTNK